MERDRPLPTGTTTFLFTDVEGSTRLLHQGAEAYAALLAEHHTRVRAIVERHGGVVVDTQGDAFFASFGSAREAVAAAAEIRDAHAGGPLQVRMGLHSGEALVAPTGYVGIEVHRAARIAAAGHGGQILISSATRELVDVPLTDLGSHRLKDLDGEQRLYQLGPERFPPLRTLARPVLPVAPTQFVGRVRELSELVALLDQPGVRLVTVCGPGGCGKTRIAARAAESLPGAFPDGVVWVNLAEVQQASGVLEQAARALDARDVAAAIGTRRLLLVLDNFEQVMDAAGDVAALLAPCPGLSILVTSREPLHVQAEHQYRLHPLAIDEAIELFLARARARAASVAVDDDLVAVCEQLDRLPLAIELAAARAGVLTVRQLRDRLSERLPLLTGGARDAPERQRTLRAAIAWSHDLLEPHERQVFDRLAVFRGGCTLEAAEAVCEADVDALLALVDKSLVRHAGGRFRLLETVHEFAVDQLAEAPDVHEIIRRHGDWYLRLAEPASQKTMHDPVLIETLDADRANLELALERALGRRDRPFALRLVGHLAYLWIARGFSEEAGRLIDRTIALAGEEAGPEALGALIAGANAALMRSDWDALRALGARLVAIGRTRRSPHALVRGLLAQAWAANNEGDFDAAVALLEEAREPAAVAGVTAAVEFELGDSLLQRGSYAEAERFFESVLRPDYPDRSSGLVIAALLNIGAARLAVGRREEAAAASLEALQTSVESGLHITAGPALALLAGAMSQQEPLAAARLLGAGEGLGGLYDSPVERSLREAAVDELTAALGRETFARLRAEGSRLSLEEALSEATAQAASRTTS